jgi:uncharacterized protein YwgA
MSEALLNQNVNLIYGILHEAITLFGKGQRWEALLQLQIAASLVYKDPKNHAALDELDRTIAKINTDAEKIHEFRKEDTIAKRERLKNMEAEKYFVTLMQILRDYMQMEGYYAMMNPDWELS